MSETDQAGGHAAKVASTAATPTTGRWGLPGDAAWWMFLTMEFTTLCIFFVVFAFMRHSDAVAFAADQQLLDPRLALANSLVLITSGYFVARAVAALAGPPSKQTSKTAGLWVVAAAALGLVFVAIKGSEYADKLGHGLSFSSSTFWFFYYFLTGFHFLHVLLGIGFLTWIANALLREPELPRLRTHTESCAAFWHMLDLVWIILFPLLYLL